MPDVIDAGPAELDALRSGREPALVMFGADWCTTCAAMMPALREIAAEAQVRILHLDVGLHPEVADSEQIRTLPTLMAFAGGEVTHRSSGVKRLAQLRRLVAELSATVEDTRETRAGRPEVP
ncbi:thioredoxin family protein [Microbacterium sp. NPDC058342]|uniref:thioredoxin family protein n=1 Tax=Microbacterium sp. NPDC058342 TaxID=3346454 RepID=UPI00365912CA